jgi:nicotinamidase/pyrazinamidase
VVDATGHRAASLYGPSTALLVVDVQNDFADPAGSLYVPSGETVVTIANREIDAALRGGATVAYTQDWHPPETPHFAPHGGTWPVHCVRGTWGAAFHPDLHLEGEVVQKGSGGEDGYSGFTTRHPATGDELPTRLETVLRCRGIDTVVVVGLATDYCVRETAADAVRLGFSTVVLEEAVAAVDIEIGDGERALAELVAVGVVVRWRS